MKYLVTSLAIVGLLWLAVPTQAGAQSLGFGDTGDGPIQIEADDGIEWQRSNQLYLARAMPGPAREA